MRNTLLLGRGNCLVLGIKMIRKRVLASILAAGGLVLAATFFVTIRGEDVRYSDNRFEYQMQDCTAVLEFFPEVRTLGVYGPCTDPLAGLREIFGHPDAAAVVRSAEWMQFGQINFFDTTLIDKCAFVAALAQNDEWQSVTGLEMANAPARKVLERPGSGLNLHAALADLDVEIARVELENLGVSNNGPECPETLSLYPASALFDIRLHAL